MRLSAGTPLSQSELIARSLRPSRRVVPVVGAGVSKGANLPDASKLAECLIQQGEFPEPPRDGASLFEVVDALDPEWRAKQLPAIIAGLVVNPPTDNAMARALVTAPSRFIVTFNYDRLLEDTALAMGMAEPVSFGNTQPELEEAHRILVRHDEWPPNQLTVLHLHGLATRPETIVLDSVSYRNLMNLGELRAIISELAHHKAMIFYGTSLNEIYLLAELQAQYNPAEHVLVCTEAERSELRTVSFPRHSIRVRTVERHEQLPEDVRSWQLPFDEGADAGPTTRPVETRRLYIPMEFRDLRDQTSDMDRLLASLDQPDDSAAPEITETVVADSHRTLVLGGAGTGKSDLLTDLALRGRSDRPTVLVRLGDQQFRPGEPERVLARWTRGAARGTPADQPVSHEAIENSAMHFLLDGLDEVPVPDQVRAAELIVQLAIRLPQHNFTVTSRAGAAAEIISARPEWSVLELAPGARWQRDFLVAHGLTLADLEAEIPADRELRTLLTTPYFLAGVVQLHQQGQLAQLHGTGELLAALIEMQLAREGRTLFLDSRLVRSWLREVALASLLASRRSLSDTELRRFALPTQVAGDQIQLADELVQRVLFAETGGIYRFAHRMLADQLAAEMLVDLGPTVKLLDALVPQRSSTIFGVRDDAQLPVALAALADSAWRNAIRERAPDLSAIATPSDADEEARLDAAEWLWMTAKAEQVWMWDRGVSRVLDPAEALGRLLAGLRHSDVAHEVRGAIHNGSRTEQGNAIRALSPYPPSGFEDDLRKVLTDHGRDGVVLRQAAIAARENGFTALIDEMVALLLVSEDSSVHQDVGLVLGELTPPERQLEVGQRLMVTDEADMILRRFLRRLPPEQQILMASAYRGDELHPDRTIRRQIEKAIRAVAASA